MGCNAWNHPAGCTCGWGGDTGGSGHSSVRHLRPANGFAWSRSGRVSLESYTNPNACCPVCGEAVFFYQSPHGGRVFFDDLGPPWPKHPCTDNGLSSTGKIEGWQSPETVIIAAERASRPIAGSLGGDFSIPRWTVRAWKPLLPEAPPSAAGDVIWVTAKIRIHGKVSLLPIPREAWCEAPIFWRWSDKPGQIEIETIDARDVLDIRTIQSMVPAWLEQGDDIALPGIHTMTAVPEPSADRWNKLGWELSFHWVKNEAAYEIAKKHEWIDWTLATNCFERAAMAGDWAGANNLGVIYRDGHGIEKDGAQAFRWFELAANSLEDRALENFARCHREGIGCNPDPDMAEFIESLRSLSHQDQTEGT